jgi:hypothetical protein
LITTLLADDNLRGDGSLATRRGTAALSRSASLLGSASLDGLNAARRKHDIEPLDCQLKENRPQFPWATRTFFGGIDARGRVPKYRRGDPHAVSNTSIYRHAIYRYDKRVDKHRCLKMTATWRQWQAWTFSLLPS